MSTLKLLILPKNNMDKFISMIILILVAVGAFYFIAGDVSLRSSGEKIYQVVIDQAVEQKIP